MTRRKFTAKVAWEICKATVQSFLEDRAMRLSAALAYYAIFSLAPLLLMAIAVAGLFWGEEPVRAEVKRQLADFMGWRTTEAVETMMGSWQKAGSGVAMSFGIAALVLGASGVFGQLQDALNAIWKVKAKPGRSLGRFIRDRFLSLAMVLGTGFLLLVSMILTTLLKAFTQRLGMALSMSKTVAQALDFIASFGVITLLFAMIFKFLPDVKVRWRDVWIGATGTALLFTCGKELLGLYLGREGTVSAYGAAGSLVVIALWVYYASIILFFGAEFTQAFARKIGSSVTPREYAQRAAE